MFATETYFVFMLIQFLRNIPKELEEAAKIASETIGPHSVTFRNEAKTTEAKKQIEYKRVVEMYLFGTGLLYRGFGCTC